VPVNARIETVQAGRLAVHSMVRAGLEAELIQVQAALDCSRRTSGILCGRWVHNQLPASAQPTFGRRNLRTLARFGIIVPTGETARSGQRAYYTLPDAAGVSSALRDLGWPG
jgi:hypothetical protein